MYASLCLKNSVGKARRRLVRHIQHGKGKAHSRALSNAVKTTELLG
jgi:hypothetical protein